MNATKNGSVVADDTQEADLDVLIVGAGFAGLYHLRKLREAGFRVRVHEAGSYLGGAWYWNKYPGARVDSENSIYQYTDPLLWQDFDFTERFPGGDELRRYFQYVDEKLDLSKDIEFDSRIESAHFDASNDVWTVRTSKGEVVRTRFVDLCVGQSSAVYIPEDLKATMGEFGGEMHHTALWPEDSVEWDGKRVAVIGAGASGVQVFQEVAKSADQVTMFQRTPNIALPMQQRPYSSADQQELKKAYPDMHARLPGHYGGAEFDFIHQSARDVTPEERERVFEELWSYGGFRFWVGGFEDVYTDEEVNTWVYNFWRDKTRARIKDPELAEKLAPTKPPHPFGTKRPCLEQSYYDAFNQDNVELVDLRATPISRFSKHGLITSDGVEREFDLIVLATGFDAVTGNVTRIDVHGLSDQTIDDKWKNGATTYLGAMTAGFPNFFFMNGPQSLNAICGGPPCQEQYGDWFVGCMKYMREHGLTRIEPQEQAEREWSDHVNALGAQTLFVKADSWYMAANVPGKARQILFYTGGQPMYFGKLREVAAAGYDGFDLSGPDQNSSQAMEDAA
ncbi:NAD(P)/FAD-dependent oxidoreductase [Stakelama sp. CBK3Z-3]|uniref:NAD(P)/FAD-dependent oxidoreductase n=1 Tax=Stakelama flava TaxID=2860338 RepID=A0ABS6XQ29_9SPHN|nr:NAD(P)/FAD-dependent oxidoreductase [Stakelama flava]MBW4332328.1 NAD(P)/FAD-dependent oxidoreductase [Stakelama flava]